MYGIIDLDSFHLGSFYAVTSNLDIRQTHPKLQKHSAKYERMTKTYEGKLVFHPRIPPRMYALTLKESLVEDVIFISVRINTRVHA